MKKKLLLSASVLLPFISAAQIKIKSLSELESGAKEAADTMQNMSLYLCGAGIAIAVIFVIYVVATNHPKAKEYVIAIFAALALYLVIINVIF